MSRKDHQISQKYANSKVRDAIEVVRSEMHGEKEKFDLGKEIENICS